jgi:hypothetical protein
MSILTYRGSLRLSCYTIVEGNDQQNEPGGVQHVCTLYLVLYAHFFFSLQFTYRYDATSTERRRLRYLI